MTHAVRETAVIAVAFAEDFDNLMQQYNILEFDISVKSEIFTLSFARKERPLETEPVQEEPEPVKETYDFNEPSQNDSI